MKINILCIKIYIIFGFNIISGLPFDIYSDLKDEEFYKDSF